MHPQGFFLWVVAVLALFSLLPFTLALKTTLPDGRVIRIPAVKPLSDGSPPPFPVNHVVARARLPKPKPAPSGHPQESQTSLDGSMCGLITPSKENWEANQAEIGLWFEKQFNDYKADPHYQNIALFLRDRWAPYTVSSSLFCDSVGTCSIGTCKNLIEDDGTNGHDRQMALFVFEQLANAAHLFRAVEKQFDYAISKVLRHSDTIIEEFSSGPRIQNALEYQLKREQLAVEIFIALALTASAFVGFFPVFAVEQAAMTVAIANMMTSSYIGVAGIAKQFREPIEVLNNLKEVFASDLNLVLDLSTESVQMDFHDLMIGGEDHLNRTVSDLMTNSTFLEPDPDFMPKLGEHVGRVVLGTAIDRLWKFDRAYIAQVENPGGCEAERTTYQRGPHQLLICLPEHPGLGFWFFSIDLALENDPHTNDYAKTRGPTGYWRLTGEDKYFGITLQDVARSARFVHENKLVEANGRRVHFDPLNIIQNMRPANEEDRMLGIFTPPICNNPGGEVISGVLDKHGLNYPCMCGNRWDGFGYNPAKDETPQFMMLSGFAQSEDYEGWCSGHNDCEEDEDIDIRPLLEAARNPGDPKIPSKLKHPYKKCKNRRDSKKHPGWPDRDRQQQSKRNRLEWAIYDEQGRNSSRAVIAFES